MGIEKRLHPRIPVNWPVVILTPKGAIKGETRNISVGGACIEYSEEADLNGELHIVFEHSKDQSMSVIGRKAWTGNFNIDGKLAFSGVGLRFTEISREDRELISSLEKDI
jgi:c-di-GMP-binding flagellar brake protein YcgR